MLIIKFVLFFIILIISINIGQAIGAKYSNRLNYLQDFKSFINLFKIKIRYSENILENIFLDISKNSSDVIKSILNDTVNNMQNFSASSAWEKSINDCLFIIKEDKELFLSFGKELGSTDVIGQIDKISVTQNMLDVKINEAEIEKQKSLKLFKTLGVVCGLAIIIVLI
jgi:stage III sporulation protein AB